MTKCSKEDCNGFITYPEFGPKFCSNVLCNWNIFKRKPSWTTENMEGDCT